MFRLTSVGARAGGVAASLSVLAIVAGCATTPRETGSHPVQVRLHSKTVAEVPGLAPRLVTYSDKRVLLNLGPAEQSPSVRMRTPELQTMVEHCSRSGGDRGAPRLRRVVLESSDGTVLAVLLDAGNQPLSALARHDATAVATATPHGAVLALTLDPEQFYGRLREQVDVLFYDAEAQVAPGVDAKVESVTTTPREMSLGQRLARINHVYIRLHNRSDNAYTLNGHDTGAMEAAADRMLTAADLHGTTIAPGESLIVRLPIEFSRTELAPGWQSEIQLEDYLNSASGIAGPVVTAVVPLRIQFEMQGAGRYDRMQRGFLTPTLQVQKHYHIESAGCFEPSATAAR